MINTKQSNKRQNIFKSSANKTMEFITNRDMFGQPVSLNYKGQDTYKTIPGGLLSLLILFVLIMYTVLKTKYMIMK